MTLVPRKELKEGDWIKYGGSADPYRVVALYSNGNGYTRLSTHTGWAFDGTLGEMVERVPEPKVWKEQFQTRWPVILGSMGYKEYNGADPEIFVLGGDGEVLEAWKFLDSKAVAAPNWKPYWDGFQAEFNTQPSTCLNAQNDLVANGLRQILNAAKKVDPKARLTPRSTLKVSLEKLATADEKYVTFGCAPSMNAYGLFGEALDNPRLLPYRFAGGHIHRRFPSGFTPSRAREIVKAVDAIAGIPSLLMFQKLDDPIRRRFYGLVGEFRLPKHGLEYRVLSSAWMCHPAIAQFTRELVRTAIGLGAHRMESAFEYTEEEVVNTFLEHDLDRAKKIVERNATSYRKLLDMQFGYGRATEAGLKLLQSPANEFCDPEKMETNWRFNDVWAGNSGLPNTRWVSFVGSL